MRGRRLPPPRLRCSASPCGHKGRGYEAAHHRQRPIQPTDAPLPADHLDHLVDPRADGAAGQRDAHRLGELAHAPASGGRAPPGTRASMPVVVQSSSAASASRRSRSASAIRLREVLRGGRRIDGDVVGEVVRALVEQVDERLGPLQQRRRHAREPLVVAGRRPAALGEEWPEQRGDGRSAASSSGAGRSPTRASRD